ncbi:hypothetical protein LPJ66_007910, partial [Kickxella alabastrina]
MSDGYSAHISNDKSTAPASNYSAATTSVLSTAPDTIESASRRAFKSTALYLQAELESAGSDIHLLEKLNDASIAKYEGISRQAQDMLVHAYKIKQTYNEM